MNSIEQELFEKTETEKEVIHKKELRIIGLSRSGNHAVINWIIRQMQGSYCFLNCTEPKFNPFLTARPLNGDGIVYKTNIENFHLEKEQLGELSKKDYFLYNHEDCFLGPFKKKDYLEKHRDWVSTPGDHKDILILRDPFNLFASRIKAGFLPEHPGFNGEKRISLFTLKRMYKQHAREFLGEKNFLKDKVLVNFNSWATDETYRMRLAQELGLPFSDQGLTEVPEVAGGSSFDGTKYAGEAHKMKLNQRWQHFALDDWYRSIFDAELEDLTLQIFGEIPPLRSLNAFDTCAESETH